MSEWIRVEDKLPPIDTEVLVFSHGNMSVCSLIQPDKEVRDVVWEDAYGYWDDDEGVAAVTHWMLLPEPPKEDSNIHKWRPFCGSNQIEMRRERYE